MKMRVTFKDPDVLADALYDIEKDIERGLAKTLNFSEADASAEAIERMIPMHDLVKKFIRYGEYITIDFDTETNTATVISKDFL